MADSNSSVPAYLSPAARAEEFIPALLALLTVIVVGGIAAFPLSILPIDVGDVQWRARVGQTFLITVPPLVFLLSVMIIAAVFAGQHRSVRILSGTFFVLAGLTIAMLPFYGLDFLSARHFQTQDSIGQYTRDGLRLAATCGVMIPFLIWAGWKGWKAGRPNPGAPTGVGHGLIVGQED